NLELSLAPDLAESADAVPVRLTYVVDETAEVEEVRFTGNTVLSEDDLRDIFRQVSTAGSFDPRALRQAVEAAANRYQGLGYRGSGIDIASSLLRDGSLEVVVRELTIASIDTTAIA